MNNDNDHLVLIAGPSSSGKSASLAKLKDPGGVIYLNCEGKKSPFRNKFKEFRVTDPNQVLQAFDEAERMPDVHTIVVDTFTYLMNMYETQKVLGSNDTQKGWQNYAQFIQVLMLKAVANSTKNVIFLAHTLTIMNEADMVMETKVPVKGATKNVGFESFFSTIIYTKRMLLTKLTPQVAESDLYTINEDEKIDKVKYVFQTRITADTINEKIRGPMDPLMWDRTETFIDNNAQFVLDRLREYYK